MSNLKEYSVVWTIDVEAEDMEDAAIQALNIMNQSNDPEYMANSFLVATFGTLFITGDQITAIDLDAEGRVE